MDIIENFKGYLLDLDIELVNLGYYSQFEYIYYNRDKLKKQKELIYTDKRNNENHLIIEFDILEDYPTYAASSYIKVTKIYN